MSLTDRQLWTVIHGMVLGALFLLAFAGGLAGLYSLRWELVPPTGLRERLPRLEIGTSVMAVGIDRRCLQVLNRCSWPTLRKRCGTRSGWSGKSTSPGWRQYWPRQWHSSSFTTVRGWPRNPEYARL